MKTTHSPRSMKVRQSHNWKLQPFALLERFQTMWNYLKHPNGNKTKTKPSVRECSDKMKQGYQSGITVKMFLYV